MSRGIFCANFDSMPCWIWDLEPHSLSHFALQSWEVWPGESCTKNPSKQNFSLTCVAFTWKRLNILNAALTQGHSSTKIVAGEEGWERSWKNVGHHGWPTEKILVFEWPKTAQMDLKFLCFFRNIFKYIQGFPYLSKQFLWTFLFLKGFFFDKNPEN